MTTVKKNGLAASKIPTAKNGKAENGKIEMVNIYSTTYGYWRYWVKEILTKGEISKFRFVKDTNSYNGKIAVSQPEVEKAKKVLAEYQKQNPDTVVMWK